MWEQLRNTPHRTMESLATQLSDLALQPAKLQLGGQDDGYDSENDVKTELEEQQTEEVEVRKKSGEEVESVKLEDETELEPLTFLVESEERESIQLVSRGPVPIDQDSQRYNKPFTVNMFLQFCCRYSPYSRTGCLGGPRGVADSDPDWNSFLPRPQLLVSRKADQPAHLAASLSWANQHEICIQRTRLPEGAELAEPAGPGTGTKVEINSLMKTCYFQSERVTRLLLCRCRSISS